MTISYLVISKTTSLLNRLLESAVESKASWGKNDEIICSWNGKSEDIKKIKTYNLPVKTINNCPYHFAKNMNFLAKQARNELLLLVNDDVILDRLTVDMAINEINKNKDVEIIGGVLRTNDGTLSHAGILFNNDKYPYNRYRPELGTKINHKKPIRSTLVPATTGALILLKKQSLIRVPFRETFKNCCEDVALALDHEQVFGNKILLLDRFSGIHNEKSTRGNTDDKEDYEQLKKIVETAMSKSTYLKSLNDRLRLIETDWVADKDREILKQLEELHKLNNKQSALIKDLTHDQLNYKNEISALKGQLNEIQQSTSWRITKPIRDIATSLRKYRTEEVNK